MIPSPRKVYIYIYIYIYIYCVILGSGWSLSNTQSVPWYVTGMRPTLDWFQPGKGQFTDVGLVCGRFLTQIGIKLKWKWYIAGFGPKLVLSWYGTSISLVWYWTDMVQDFHRNGIWLIRYQNGIKLVWDWHEVLASHRYKTSISLAWDWHTTGIRMARCWRLPGTRPVWDWHEASTILVRAEMA